jgi:hypothetical protein
MGFPRCRLVKIALAAAVALVLASIIALSVGGSAFAQRRPAAPATPRDRAPACFESCASQCSSIGGSSAGCSRTCYAQCSGISGNIDNRH